MEQLAEIQEIEAEISQLKSLLRAKENELFLLKKIIIQDKNNNIMGWRVVNG